MPIDTICKVTLHISFIIVELHGYQFKYERKMCYIRSLGISEISTSSFFCENYMYILLVCELINITAIR